MRTINVHAAKTQVSRLLDDAAAGREIIVAKAGAPVAKLVPLAFGAPPPERRLGSLAGMASIPEAFEAPLPEQVLDAFERC